MQINTKALLDVVARQTSVDESLRVLARGQSDQIKALSDQLREAIAANDPAALAQVQADLDSAAASLTADADKSAEAVKANTPAAAAGPGPSPA